MNRFTLTLLVSLLLPSLALAAQPSPIRNMPIVYALGNITIQRNGTTPAEQATAVPTSMQLDVEIRGADSFYKQDGWYTLTSIKPGKGLLIIFEEPQQAAITQASQYAPVDIAMVDAEGTIISVVPSLVLAKLEEPITPQKPIKAFLMLAGGVAEELFIQPGDDIIYSAFKKPHPVITTPQPSALAPPPADATAEGRMETPEQKVLATMEAKRKEDKKKNNESFDLQQLFATEPAQAQRRKPRAQPTLPKKQP